MLCVVSVSVEPPQRPASVTADHRQYSVQALMLLAEVTVTLLDVVYRSEEKERVIPQLSNILYNVFPYLKNHRSDPAVPLLFLWSVYCRMLAVVLQLDIYELIEKKNVVEWDWEWWQWMNVNLQA